MGQWPGLSPGPLFPLTAVNRFADESDEDSCKHVYRQPYRETPIGAAHGNSFRQPRTERGHVWNTIECLHSLGYASDEGSSENGVPMRSTLETKNWPVAAGLFFCQTRRVATRLTGSFTEPGSGPFAQATISKALPRTGNDVHSAAKSRWIRMTWQRPGPKAGSLPPLALVEQREYEGSDNTHQDVHHYLSHDAPGVDAHGISFLSTHGVESRSG